MAYGEYSDFPLDAVDDELLFRHNVTLHRLILPVKFDMFDKSPRWT